MGSITKIKKTKDKTVTLTLPELCKILCGVAAKFYKIDEACVDEYVEAYAKDYMPVATYVYKQQQQDIEDSNA